MELIRHYRLQWCSTSAWMKPSTSHMENCRNSVSGVTLKIEMFSLIEESILRPCVKLGLEWRSWHLHLRLCWVLLFCVHCTRCICTVKGRMNTDSVCFKKKVRSNIGLQTELHFSKIKLMIQWFQTLHIQRKNKQYKCCWKCMRFNSWH